MLFFFSLQQFLWLSSCAIILSASNRNPSLVSLPDVQQEKQMRNDVEHVGHLLTIESLTKSHVIRAHNRNGGSSNPSMEESSTFSSSGVREAFVQFFVSLLSCYRHCYTLDNSPEDTPVPMGKFKVIENQVWDKKQFVHEQSRSYQAGRDARDFLSSILDTQLFEDFVRTHTPREEAPTEIKLFDEYVVLFRGKLYTKKNKQKKKDKTVGTSF